MTGHKQTTDGQQYTTGYTYNLAGGLVEETYPSGRVMRNVLDGNGDLSMVESRKNASQGFWHYADSISYAPSGAVASLQLGNGHWESTTFDSRLHPTQIALGVLPGQTNLLQLDYGYGTTQNNGNVLSQTITVKRTGQSDLVFNQNYTYDSLNRISFAEETTGGTSNWKQTYTFDRYGNRRFDQNNTTFPLFNNPNLTNPTFNTANNRMASGQNWNYDSAGNVTGDPDGKTFTFDAENKQVKVRDSGNATVGEYFFDGDGKRVKKVVPANGEVTIFVYDAAGKLVAEYSTLDPGQVESGSGPQVAYLTNDNLGTPRINTNASGAITARHDYMPYGEAIIALGGRSNADGYDQDSIRQAFTSYVSDIEAGLYFAQSRMYAGRLGRFMLPDAPFADQSEQIPQSWNLYGYVLNNPLLFIDPSGLWKQVDCSSGQCWEAEKGDTLTSLAKILGVSAKSLTQFFGDVNPNRIDIGRVFDVSGYESWQIITSFAMIGIDIQQYEGDKRFDRNDPKLAQNFPSQPGQPGRNEMKDGLKLFVEGGIDGFLTVVPIPLPSKILVLGRVLKVSSKIIRQAPARGWTKKLIQEAVEFGQKIPAVNKVNPGNPATRYVHPTTGQSVVIDDVTNQILQVGGPGFRY